MADIDIYGLHGQSRDEEERWGVIGAHQEILGAAEEILGLEPGALQSSSSNVKRGSAFQAALAQRLAKRTPIVQKVNPTKKRRWMMGFGPTAIPPSSTVTIQAQPQCLFRGEKLLNTGDSANLFIQGLFVGQKSQLPTFQNPISVGAFAVNALDNELLMDQLGPR